MELPSLGGPYDMAHALNDGGTLTGESQPAGDGRGSHAVRWDKQGHLTDFTPTLAQQGDYAGGNDINRAGIIAGFVSTGGTLHAAKWDSRGRITDLSPDAIYGNASAINSSGAIAGQVEQKGKPTHAVMWDARGGVTDIGALLPGSTYSIASDINDRGVVVGGWSTADTWHSFVYDHGRISEPIRGGSVFGINAAGTITGIQADSALVTVTKAGKVTLLQRDPNL